MREITINTSALGNDIELIETHLKKIRTNLDKMYDSVKLLDSMWDGPANDIFNNQFSADREAMGAVCENLDKILNSMKMAKKEYEACDREVGSIVAGIRV